MKLPYRTVLLWVWVVAVVGICIFIERYVPNWFSLTVLPILAFAVTFLATWFWRVRWRRRCPHHRKIMVPWTHSDGTPMLTMRCLDCPWRDEGPIYR